MADYPNSAMKYFRQNVDRTGKKAELTGKKAELPPSNPRAIRPSALYKQRKTFKNAKTIPKDAHDCLLVHIQAPACGGKHAV